MASVKKWFFYIVSYLHMFLHALTYLARPRLPFLIILHLND